MSTSLISFSKKPTASDNTFPTRYEWLQVNFVMLSLIELQLLEQKYRGVTSLRSMSLRMKHFNNTQLDLTMSLKVCSIILISNIRKFQDLAIIRAKQIAV